MAYNQYDAVTNSLAKTAGSLTEMYIPLWWYSYLYFSSNNTGTTSSMLGKGDTAIYNSTFNQAKLHTLSPYWSANQKFAFEISAYTNGGSYSVYAQLYDFTSGTMVSGSQISTMAGSYTVLRSGQFTLTPGHVYGVCAWVSNGSYYIYLTKASLIAFLS